MIIKVGELIRALQKMNPQEGVCVIKEGKNPLIDDIYEVVGYYEVKNSKDIIDTAFIIIRA